MGTSDLLICDSRESDGIKVELVYAPDTNAVAVCVWDFKERACFGFVPPRDRALDAFQHPYAYVNEGNLIAASGGFTLSVS